MSFRPHTAFVLAAGLGRRMRPLSDQLPKPLVPLAGRALIDHVLDRIAAAGVARAVINVHYRADQIERHVASRTVPRIEISDERAELLETGGGLRKALPLLGTQAFLVHNSDTVWLETGTCNLLALAEQWDETRMDAMLLLADRATSLGYTGQGDFTQLPDGRLQRVTKGHTAPFVFAGASIAHPRLLRDTPEGAFSLNRVWDRALAEQRLFGLVLSGTWMHVGDPQAHAAAERLIAHAGQA